jgi:hypothetical protein
MSLAAGAAVGEQHVVGFIGRWRGSNRKGVHQAI